MVKYFTINDDFKFIIKQFFPNVKSIVQISTGWTNFVFKAKIKRRWWVFRFPRNSFFCKVLYKEAGVCEFLHKEKLNVRVPRLTILHYKSKPFSIHKMISGVPLTECKLKGKQTKKIAKEICLFMNSICKIKVPIKLPLASTFLKNLSSVSGEGYDLHKHDLLKKMERQESVFSHGDLNPGNILIKRGKVVAILDFAFACKSSPLNDLARLLERVPEQQKLLFVEEYEKIFRTKINLNELSILISMWQYVELRYIEYIKKKHPDIQLPKSFS